jgi:DNA-binding IclR family transcriptional regulator
MPRSTAGQAMLAHADLQLLDSIVKYQGLPALVAETITSWRNFDRNWRRFAANGNAWNPRGEHRRRGRCATPVFDSTGRLTVQFP